VGKVVNGVFKKGWLYQDQLNPVAELDSTGQVVSRFVYGTKGHMPDYLVKSDSTYRFITDHLGSVRLVVNVETSHIAQCLDYDEFGNVLVNTNEGFQPFGYAGGLFDEKTGLVRFGARDYDAGVGRWTAKDPIGFASGLLNIYSYCASNPICFFDSSGLQVNPTGGSVRGQDVWGSGHYGASRDSGTRSHAGVDYIGNVGGAVVAPYSGSMEVLNENEVRITTLPDATSTQISCRLLHIVPNDAVGSIRQVTEADTIGRVEDITGQYPGITTHVHLEIYTIQDGQTTRQNPRNYIPEP
jgi:RHS repeat-associated protein